tara:strand:+ start:298 stop:831 length:534 start_codon:yes stop_codon:yes gene_type:complete
MITELLEKYPYLFSQLFSIYLVHKGGRRATLIDIYENNKPDIKSVKLLKKIAIKYNLVYTDWVHGFPIISTPLNMSKYLKMKDLGTNEALGRFLGFTCYNHDEYWNHKNARISLEIYVKEREFPYRDRQIYAEVCEKSKIKMKELELKGKQKVKKFTKSLPVCILRKYKLYYKVENM